MIKFNHIIIRKSNPWGEVVEEFSEKRKEKILIGKKHKKEEKWEFFYPIRNLRLVLLHHRLLVNLLILRHLHAADPATHGKG